MNERIQAASIAFTEAMAAGWERCPAILIAAISACQSARELSALFHAGGINELVFGDAPLEAETADAIVERAVSFRGEDGADALGWLGALSGFGPRALFSLGSLPEVRKEFRRGVERHIELLRAWSNDASAERRVAAAYVLPYCANATAEDARALVERAATEGDADALATSVLATGMLHKRLDLDPVALRGLATRTLAQESALARLCAAATLGRIGDVLTKDATLAVVQHVKEPIAFPSAWAAGGLMSILAAAAVLSWMTTSAPEEAIAALATSCNAALPVEPKTSAPEDVIAALRAAAQPSMPLGARNVVAATLFRLAFDGRGVPVPDAGVAMDDLDAVQRTAALAIAKLQAPIGALHFGLTTDMSAFVKGDELHFRPIAVAVGGRERKWHFARILGAVATGEAAIDVGRDAVLRLADADAADLASRWSCGRMFLDGRIKDAAGRDRMLSLCLSILAALRERGFDVDALARASVDETSRSSPDVGILAIATLRAHAEDVPDDLLPLLARAVAQGWWKDQLLAGIRTLPARSRAKVTSATKLPL